MTTKTKLVCGLVAIFAAGIVVGVSVGFTTARKSQTPTPTAEQKKEPGSRLADKWCSKLSDDLSLTPEQIAKIKYTLSLHDALPIYRKSVV